MAQQSVYQESRPIPFELREHCIIYLEEQLYSQALTLLTNLVACSTSTSLPAFTPSPLVLSLASTLAVHPALTTKTTTTEKHLASHLALRLLQTINTHIGPVNANFRSAFAFALSRHGHLSPTKSRRLNKRQQLIRQQEYEDELRNTPAEALDQEEVLNTKLASSDSLFSKANSFWQVVGWALNCSIKHPARWASWKGWLEFMAGVLEDDWNERCRVACRRQGVESVDDLSTDEDVLCESLIVQYIGTDTMLLKSSTTSQRILKATFADGTKDSCQEFHEVWKGETDLPKEDKKDVSVRSWNKGHEIRVEEGDFGDYYADQQEEDENEKILQQERKMGYAVTNSGNIVQLPPSPKGDQQASGGPLNPFLSSVDDFGGLDSVMIRRRLLSLLLTTSIHTPATSLPYLDLLYAISTFIRPLSLPAFQLFISPTSKDPHIPVIHTALLRLLLSKGTTSTQSLTASQIIQYFLPNAANTSTQYTKDSPENSNQVLIDNVRVVLLLEASFLHFLCVNKDAGAYQGLKREEIRDALRKGIAVRGQKIAESYGAGGASSTPGRRGGKPPGGGGRDSGHTAGCEAAAKKAGSDRNKELHLWYENATKRLGTVLSEVLRLAKG